MFYDSPHNWEIIRARLIYIILAVVYWNGFLKVWFMVSSRLSASYPLIHPAHIKKGLPPLDTIFVLFCSFAEKKGPWWPAKQSISKIKIIATQRDPSRKTALSIPSFFFCFRCLYPSEAFLGTKNASYAHYLQHTYMTKLWNARFYRSFVVPVCSRISTIRCIRRGTNLTLLG